MDLLQKYFYNKSSSFKSLQTNSRQTPLSVVYKLNPIIFTIFLIKQEKKCEDRFSKSVIKIFLLLFRKFFAIQTSNMIFVITNTSFFVRSNFLFFLFFSEIALLLRSSAKKHDFVKIYL